MAAAVFRDTHCNKYLYLCTRTSVRVYVYCHSSVIPFKLKLCARRAEIYLYFCADPVVKMGQQ